MKKKILYLGLSMFALSGLISACSPKASVESSESTSAVGKGEEGSNADYIYAKLDLPYADFYYGELNNIEPEANTSDLKADLESTDKVAVAGLRESGEYDSVSSPTTKKLENFKSTYGSVENETSKIEGVKNVNIAISKSLYEDAKKAIEENKESKNELLNFVKNISETGEVAPKEYKVLNSDGTFSKTIGTTKKDEAAKAEISSTSNYGNYEIHIKDANDIDIDTVLGAIIETSDGKKYGLKHLDNIWTKAVELAFSVTNFTDKAHKADKEFARFSDMEGKTISKITYLLSDADDVEIDTSLFVKKQAPTEYKVSGDESAKYNKDGSIVNYKLEAGDTEYKLSRIIYRKNDLENTVNTDTAGILKLPKEYTPGKYQFVFSNDEYSDLSFTTLLDSGLSAEDFSFSDNKLSLKDNPNALDIKTYINSTNSAKVLETEYKGGRGRRFGKTVFNEDGSINLEATVKGDNGEVKIFDGADKFPVSIKADGYPDIEFEVVK